MSKKLGEIVEPKLIESGVYPGVDINKAPIWASGANVNFREGSVQKMDGYVELATLANPINAIEQAFVGGKERAYLGTASELFYFQDNIATLLQNGIAPGFWSLVPWGDWLLAINGASPLKIWKNGGAVLDVVTPFTSAQNIEILKFHVIAFNTTGSGSNGPNRIAWSSADNPELWTTAANNSAGGLNIRNISSPIQAAELLGDSMAIYSLDQMYLLNYVGGTLVFGYDETQASLGAIGKNAVTSVGRTHFGVERRGFWQTDGVQDAFIDDPAVKDYAAARIDYSKPNEIVCYHDRNRKQVEWFYPVAGSASWEGLAYNYDSRHWTQRDFRLNAAQSARVFAGPLAGAGVKLVRMGTGVNAGSSPLAAVVRTKPLDMTLSNNWKFLDEIRLKLSGTVRMRVGVSETPNGPIEWLPDRLATEQNFYEREGVFFTLEFYSVGINENWSVNAIEFFGEIAGMRV